MKIASRLFAEPHAGEQIIPADELVEQGRANVQGHDAYQERPTRSVDNLPGVAAAVEGLRDRADAVKLGKVSALQRHDQP